MPLRRASPCKINLLLNVLGRRPDGFHELETIMQPVNVCDTLEIERLDQPGIHLTCNAPSLPCDSSNLVHRAAVKFLEAVKLSSAGARIHLEKRIPLAAGLGGGSSNAATTLLALNELFDHPLAPLQLHELAVSIGSDVPFFLQSQPALATGRGERITPLRSFPVLRGAWVLLIHPGFGIATPWAYQNLARFPAALNGLASRAAKLIQLLNGSDLWAVGCELLNALEAPALEKYPILELYQKFLRDRGAAATLMSGSGSATFAIFGDRASAEAATPAFKEKFGENCWMAIVPL